MFTENSMSSQALRQISMFLAAAIIIWACQTCCRFSYILRFAGTVLSIINFNNILFFSSVLLRDQKWGMDLLGISGFFSQRAHTRNFSGSHPRVTFLSTHKLFLFSSQYDDSSTISCCPYRTSWVGTLSRVIKVYQEMHQNSHVYPCIAMYTYV